MKIIEKKTYDMKLASSDPKSPEDKPATTAALIKLCLDRAPQGGFSRADLKQRDRIEKAIAEDAKLKPKTKEIDIEDADYVNLKACVTAMRWGGRHPDLLDFVESFEK